MSDVRASKLEKTVQKATKTDKVKVFLGGLCDHNEWREELKKEFGGSFFFMDPYDENWDPKDNIYDELAGMVNADYIIFYKGGKQTEREKDFLKNIGEKDPAKIKEFEDLNKIKEFLKSIKKMTKKACVADVLRRCASILNKSAVPYENTLNKGGIDFIFESLDNKSRGEVIEDFERGKTIIIPEMTVGNKKITNKTISKKDFDYDAYADVLRQMKGFLRQPAHNPTLIYDPVDSTYMYKEAKLGATYSKASTQIELPKEIAQEIMSWGVANVPDKDLYTEDKSMGRENEIHVTLFYGILDDDPEKIRAILSGIKPFECRLGLVTAFKDEKKYDVLKIDVESPEMVKLHYLIEGNIKNKNTHPTFQAHCTIAYVKKGKADKLIGEDKFRGVTFKVTEVIFSNKDHDKVKIPLGT